MYRAMVIEAFIESPSDVIRERETIRNVIDEWNIIHSKSSNIIIRHLGWERHVYSSMEDGRAQESINKQILEDSDILIGVFWTRVGTPTGEYPSGSIEEIEKHISTGKPTMLFFSNSPVPPDSVNPEQYKKLSDFKANCKERGLVTPYTSLEEFERSFRTQLGLMINTHPYFSSIIIRAGAVDVEAARIAEQAIYLSDEAQQLLKEISFDKHNVLVITHTFGKFSVQTNGKDFGCTVPDGRGEAQINSAIKELIQNDLIQQADQRGEVFKMTQKGFGESDSIIIQPE